jgi:hypothetical protein
MQRLGCVLNESMGGKVRMSIGRDRQGPGWFEFEKRLQGDLAPTGREDVSLRGPRGCPTTQPARLSCMQLVYDETGPATKSQANPDKLLGL